ncbi:conserved hypothetical protein [Nitrosopumilaceae archaeon]|nr:hypothetical protein [Nitrosopumilus sp.]MDA7945588.1 hypothetical protein [Nitrosopumilus sp.]MDA7955447.1 hypothetical protein [Nitrosopumilus sp.]MDA7997523.1 hypothetical protein [Nitrosopumilus sp.]CAI9832359.1 conserved hypothetical protein [Nitrosopumilaceae archaeon]
MDDATPEHGRPPVARSSWRIKNTFSSADNEYFTPATLFALCKYGFPFEKLPEDAKEKLIEYCREYDKRCTHSDGEIKIASLDVPPGDRLI